MIHEITTGGVKVLFDDEDHKFWKEIDGKKTKLASVTTYTGIISKGDVLMLWAVKLAREHLLGKIENGEQITVQDILEACKQHTYKKQEAANVGTQIHALCEAWIKKQDFEIPEDDRIRNGFDAFLKFQKEHKFRWVESEMPVYSKEYDFPGVLDAVAKDSKGKLVLVDFKSSNGLYDEYALQAAAYQIAYEEMTGKKIDYRLVIRFGKEDGEFEARKYEDNDADKEAFLACVKLKRRLGDLKLNQ